MEEKTAYKTQEGKNEIFKAYDAFFEKWLSPYEEISADTRYGVEN